jgi:adenylate cyclase
MPDPLEILVYDGQRLVFSAECFGPAELGRQRNATERPFTARAAGTVTRVVIARPDENTVPRAAVLVVPLAGGAVRLHNRSPHLTVGVQGGEGLPPGAVREVALPVLLTLGPRAVRVQVPEPLQGLPEATVPPGRGRSAPRFPTLAAGTPADGVAVVRWLQAVMDVLQSAAATDEFFARAERAVVDAVGLDVGRVLLLDESDDWRPHAPRPDDRPPSRSVLEQVRREKRTFWAAPQSLEAASLERVQAVVAAPILDRAGRVIGALYGDRGSAGGSVTEVEARLMELLAGGVAAGLARLKQERAALEAQVRFEQFFTRELAQHLSADPGLLAGRDAEVTMLFADVRGFSRVSERLGPGQTAAWMRDVLGELSGCVRAEGGVLIDYVGDELVALWGAPCPQPDHATRAGRAAQAMLRRLPELDDRWRERMGEPLRVGVGVHTGPAWVGEVGTEHKFKYGPQGPTVNLASRVQGATKYLRVPALVTGATRAKLGDNFPTRRLTKVRVVNIQAAVDLYELAADPPLGWAGLRDGYEAALAAFEAGDARGAARRLGNLLAEHPGDGPALLLLSRAVNVLVAAAEPYDPVWELPGK